MGDLSTLQIVGGTFTVSTLVVSFVTWLLTRVVKTEDTSKAALAEKCAALEKRCNTFDIQLSEMKLRNEAGVNDTSTKMSSLATSVGELKGLVTQLGNTIEQNRDKMSAFYRGELRELETKLSNEMKDLERMVLSTRASKRK